MELTRVADNTTKCQYIDTLCMKIINKYIDLWFVSSLKGYIYRFPTLAGQKT